MKTNHPNIRAVAFDYGGVLAYFIDKETIGKMAEVAGVDHISFETSMWKFREELDSGEYAAPYYWSLVLEDCKSPVGGASINETLTEMDLKGFSRMNQGMITWANTLKEQGFITLIISNMAESTYQSLIAPQPWMKHFDIAVISGIIGINKPDKRIFTHATERLDLDAAEVLFLDDLIHNVAGAKQAGLYSLVFSTTGALAQELALHYPNLPVAGLL